MEPITPSHFFAYWKPWKEGANLFESWMDYAKDTTLAKYSADTIGTYISQASMEQVSAINALGNKIGLGLNVLSNQLVAINSQLNELNRHSVIQIEQQKLTNLLLENIGELLRVPDSEKERQRSIELGLKFFVNAQKDDDLFDDALEELLKAEELMKQDYFVLHRIGLIYMYSIKNINLEKALEYFTNASKYALVESDPKAVRLANVLSKFDEQLNSASSSDTKAIEALAADSLEKAAFAAYVLGNFELSISNQSKAFKFNASAENQFKLAKYQIRMRQVDACLQNLESSIEKQPLMVLAAFKDLDLINEPLILQLIERKNLEIDTKINDLIDLIERKKIKHYRISIEEIESLKHKEYSTKVFGVLSVEKLILEFENIVMVGDQCWMAQNLNVTCFSNGDPIAEARTEIDWEYAGKTGKPVWCHVNNKPENDKKYGKFYNWFAINDQRKLAPDGWHLPDNIDCKRLLEILHVDHINYKKINSSKGWTLPDEWVKYFEDHFELGGRRNFEGTFVQFGLSASWWLTGESNKIVSLHVNQVISNRKLIICEDTIQSMGLFVRCLWN